MLLLGLSRRESLIQFWLVKQVTAEEAPVPQRSFHIPRNLYVLGHGQQKPRRDFVFQVSPPLEIRCHILKLLRRIRILVLLLIVHAV